MPAVNDYIFLLQNDFIAQRGGNINALISKTKGSILQRAVEQHEQRLAAFGGGDLKKARSILENEDLMKQMNQQIEEPTATAAAFPATFEAALQVFESANSKIIDASEFSQRLDNFLSTLDNEYFGVGLKEEYYRQVRGNFIANRALGRQIGSQATVEERMYASLMDSKYTGKAFYLNKTEIGSKVEASKLNSSVGKIYALKGLIDAGGAGDSQNFWQDVAYRIKKWMNDFLGSVGEVAFYEAFVKGESQFFKSLKGHINTRFFAQLSGNSTSGVNFDCRFSEDPTLTAMYKRLEKELGSGKAYSVRNNKTNVSDINIKINQDGVVGTAGISVKDYRLNDITDGSKAFNIHTQSNTPLLTFLLRECEFSTSELVTLMNVGAALYTVDSLAGAWETIQEQVKYRGILATLAGLEGTTDQVYYMALNGRIFTMSQILNNIRQNVEAGKNVSIISYDGPGFDRDRYQQINRNNFVDEGDRDVAAQMRSEQTQAQLMALLYSTKVSTSLNLYGLSSLLT